MREESDGGDGFAVVGIFCLEIPAFVVIEIDVFFDGFRKVFLGLIAANKVREE